MKNRGGVLLTLAGVFLICSCAAVGQESWQLPRTSSGVPDFQGTWTSATIST